MSASPPSSSPPAAPPAQPLPPVPDDIMQSVAGEEDPGASLDLPVKTARVGPGPAVAVDAQGADVGCPTCGGSGQRAGGPCPACRGTGRVAGGSGSAAAPA